MVDVLNDARDLDAQAERQIAELLHRRGREDHPLADEARRVGVGNVVADDVQADLHRLQRVARHLDGAEERHDEKSRE